MEIREALEQLCIALERENCRPERIDIVMPSGHHGGDTKIRDLLLGGKLAQSFEWHLATKPNDMTDPGWSFFTIGNIRVCLRKVGQP